MTTSIRYREFDATASCASHVLNFWEFAIDAMEDETYQHHVPPDGCLSLVIRYSSASQPTLIVVGPRVEPLQVNVTESDHYFGMRFWPYAANAVLGADAQPFFGIVESALECLPELANKIFRVLPDRPDPLVVVASLSDVATLIADQLPPVDRLVHDAVEYFVATSGKCSVAELADRLGISQRQLQRRFRTSTGMTPKQFGRIRRFRNAAAELLREKPRPWAAVAFESGFADQSHLTREFSQLVGLTAEELRERYEHIVHDGVDP